MSSDIPKTVEEETDALAERIFSEWDKWFDGADDPRKVTLRDLQNEILEIRDQITETGTSEQKLQLTEKAATLTKELRQNLKELLEEINPAPVQKKTEKQRKRKR